MFRFVIICLIALNLVHCGYPGKDLNPLEKQAEIEWVFGTFERNYAPAEWKAAKHGTSLSQIKLDCVEKSKTITKGDEFIGLLNECVNRFQDAHTRIIAGGQTLPELITIAYLGFQTEFVRFDKNSTGKTSKNPGETSSESSSGKSLFENPVKIQDGLLVTNLLATTVDPNFPITKGDIIVRINDQPIRDYLQKTLVPSNNLGNEMSSLVIAGSKFAIRESTLNPLPKESDISLEFIRSGLTYKTKLPWIQKDFFAFISEQDKAKKDQSKENSHEQEHQTQLSTNSGYWVGTDLIDYALNIFSKFRKSHGSRVALLLSETFHFFNYSPAQEYLFKLNQANKEKQIGSDSDPIDLVIGKSGFDVSVPPFVARIFFDEHDNRLGFIRIGSFSVGNNEVKTFRKILARMNQMKIKGLILDLLNNGGGSLEHGLAMVNALTEQPLTFPSLQVALNDHWINGFKADSIYAPSDAQKTLARRVFDQLQEDLSNKMRVSRPISTTELAPFVLQADKQNCIKDESCLKNETRIVLLVNEMCASMCDIFAGVFRDNKLGTIVGAQTMGAGGNVVLHGFSPITQVALSQTESLILDANGHYLENQGIVPDYIIDTTYDKIGGFSETYKKAISLLQ